MTTTHILGFRTWNRMEALTVLFASAVLFLQMAVILFLNPELGKAMAKFVLTLTIKGSNASIHFCQYIYRMVGPMVFPLLALTAIEIGSVMKLVKSYRSGYWELESIEKLYRALRIVENASCGLGFLGTVIGLIHTLYNLNPTLSQPAMLKMFFEEASSAFGSTVYGTSLAIIATVCREIFDGFLMPTERDKQPAVFVKTKDSEIRSMILFRRESLPCGDC